MKLSERRDLCENFDNAFKLSKTVDLLIPDGVPDDEPIMVTAGLMQRIATTFAFVSGAAAGGLPSEAECVDDLSMRTEGSDAHGNGHDIG